MNCTFVLHLPDNSLFKGAVTRLRYILTREGSLWSGGFHLNSFPGCHFKIRGKRCAFNIPHDTKMMLLSYRQGLRGFFMSHKSVATLARESSERLYLLSLIIRNLVSE